MADDSRVQELLNELGDSGCTPEEVCAACPKLLPEVRRRWLQMCAVKADLHALFPTPGSDAGPGADTSVPWHTGDELPQISGYEVEALLWRGGMGLVYKARHLRLNRFVALKMLIAGAYAGPNERARFQREAEAVAGLRLFCDAACRDAATVEQARTVLGRERMTRAHPLLSREAVVFEELTGELATATENVLRKHGREIAEMQYTQKRIADMAIDLYAIAACLSRTTRAIERRGEDGARREIDLTSIFTSAAQKRLRQNVYDFTRNDDELRKAVAGRSYTDGAYPFDVL